MVRIIPAKLPKLIGSLKTRPTTKRQPPQNSSIEMTAVTWALTRMFFEFCLWLSSDSPKYSLFLRFICLLNQCRCQRDYTKYLYYCMNFRLSCLLTCSYDRKCVRKRRSQIRWVILHMLIWFGLACTCNFCYNIHHNISHIFLIKVVDTARN